MKSTKEINNSINQEEFNESQKDQARLGFKNRINKEEAQSYYKLDPIRVIADIYEATKVNNLTAEQKAIRNQLFNPAEVEKIKPLLEDGIRKVITGYENKLHTEDNRKKLQEVIKKIKSIINQYDKIGVEYKKELSKEANLVNDAKNNIKGTLGLLQPAIDGLNDFDNEKFAIKNKIERLKELLADFKDDRVKVSITKEMLNCIIDEFKILKNTNIKYEDNKDYCYTLNGYSKDLEEAITSRDAELNNIEEKEAQEAKKRAEAEEKARIEREKKEKAEYDAKVEREAKILAEKMAKEKEQEILKSRTEEKQEVIKPAVQPTTKTSNLQDKIDNTEKLLKMILILTRGSEHTHNSIQDLQNKLDAINKLAYLAFAEKDCANLPDKDKGINRLTCAINKKENEELKYFVKNTDIDKYFRITTEAKNG